MRLRSTPLALFLAAAFGVFIVFVAVILPFAVQQAREAARRGAAKQNMRQLSEAMRQYQERNAQRRCGSIRNGTRPSSRKSHPCCPTTNPRPLPDRARRLPEPYSSSFESFVGLSNRPIRVIRGLPLHHLSSPRVFRDDRGAVMDLPISLNDLPESLRNGWAQCWHLGAAFALALPIGWDRERQKGENGAGVRTFPLVAIAACGIFLLGKSISNGEAEPLARVVYGVVTGIGFLGGGAILKEQGQVTGLTTAASLWNTAAIGLAVGAEQFAIAIALSAANFALLRAKRKGPTRPEPTTNGGP